MWNEKSSKWFAVHKAVLMPWDVNIKCVGIQGEGISIFNSATKPWKIPFVVKKEGKDKIMNILVKFEDVRKDKLTMAVAEYLKKICMTYVDIDLYCVFPINTKMGWGSYREIVLPAMWHWEMHLLRQLTSERRIRSDS